MLPLIELVCRAATEPALWADFCTGLSAELDDAAVGVTLDLFAHGSLAYQARIDTAYESILSQFVVGGRLPWSYRSAVRDRFCNANDVVSGRDIATSEFYRAYMQPQGLVPTVPVVHLFGSSEGIGHAGIGIFQREGRRALTAADLQWLDLLVPHLSQAFHVHSLLAAHTQRRDAYREVLDRFPLGVILLDANGSVVIVNRTARRIAALDDGLGVVDGRVVATLPESARALERAIRAIEAPDGPEYLDTGITVSRPSGGRPFLVMLSHLVAVASRGDYDNAVVALFVSDPEFRQLEMRSLLGTFHQLTRAEIELAALVCEGETLESAAAARGVSVHTARSQLKKIFQKTGTKRQAELVGLVKHGLTQLAGHAQGKSDGVE